jgi:predicted HAD superfamily Cof-like phosphohydrolase
VSYHTDVGEFHRKFGLRREGHVPPRPLDDDTFIYRYNFLLEELLELGKAHAQRDLPEFADALADIIYIASGTAHLAGIPLDAVWAEVQRANMSKERATGPDDPRSKRGHVLDVVKPTGWVAPDHGPALRAAGWRG